MARKNITIDIEAYKRLKQHQREDETFSDVIKRIIKPPFDRDAWLKLVRKAPMDKKFVAAVEEQVAGRLRRSRKRK